MKNLKYLVIVSLLLCLGFALVAEDFTYTLDMPIIRHARISSLGGAHIADISWYYSFLTNPANIGLMGKKTLYPGLTIGFGGPIQYAAEILDTINDGDEDSLLSLGKLLSENKGLDLDFLFSGPIQFGSVKNNVGWGFFNQTFLAANIPSINHLESYVRNESLLRFGFAHPISLGIGLLSIGTAIDVVNRVEGKLTSSVVELVNDNADDIAVPLYTSFAFGLDAGASLKISNFLVIGLVWDDLLKGYFTSKAPDFLSGDLEPNASFQTINFGWVFNLGANATIPYIDITTLGAITSINFMLDFHDVIGMIINDPKKRNPILDINFGAEAVFIKTIGLRLGLHEMYPALGLGAKFGSFNIDLAVFGRELGIEPGFRPQLNFALSLEFFK